MKVYLVTNETLLFEGFGWGIIEAEEYGVYATHEGCTKPYDDKDGEYSYGEYCWYPTDKAVCILCDAPVPIEIQALVQLQGWDGKGWNSESLT